MGSQDAGGKEFLLRLGLMQIPTAFFFKHPDGTE